MKPDFIRIKRRARRLIRGFANLSDPLGSGSPKLVVLVYHRVVESAGPDPYGIATPESVFKDQIERLSLKYPIISLDDAVSQIKSGSMKKRAQLVITFDDGYLDNYHTAFPYLRKLGLVATFYLPAYYIGSPDPLWETEVMSRIVRGNGSGRVEINGSVMRRGPFESAVSFSKRVLNILKGANMSTINGIVRSLRSGDDQNAPIDLSGDLCMTWENASDMGRNGMSLGSHGYTHRSLARLPRTEAVNEIAMSKKTIEDKAGVKCDSFAFPFGGPNDYNQSLIEDVKSSGFGSCMLNIHGSNTAQGSVFGLRRVIMDRYTDVDDLLG